MRRIAITAISAVTIVVASLVLVASGRLPLHALGAAAATESAPQVGSWLLTLTDQSSQTTPVLMTLTSDGTLTAGELPVPAGALLPGPSESPAASPGETFAPTPTEQPLPTELPTTPSGLLNSPGQGTWTPTSDTDFIFTYVVLQSDQAGTFAQRVTVSGTAALDDTQDALTGTYSMSFAAPDGSDLGSSSGTILGSRIQLALIAAFDAKQSAGSLDVLFKDQSTGDPTSWNWDFGDGSLSADAAPTHTYDQPGDYTVSLTVSNDTSSATTTQTITVGQVSSPKANFTTAQTPGSLEIKFTDTSTGGPNAWTWNFGDGKTSDKPNPRHTYAKAGQYSVKLLVSNAGGEDTHFETITVAKPPTAAFTVQQASGSLEVKFVDASKGTPATWAWDFGDGGSSTKPNPKHTYAKAGSYDVMETVTNGAGSNSTTVTVTVPPSPSESPGPSESTAP